VGEGNGVEPNCFTNLLGQTQFGRNRLAHVETA